MDDTKDQTAEASRPFPLSLLPEADPDLQAAAFNIPMPAVGKPRMTRFTNRQSPPIKRYQAWKDEFQLRTNRILTKSMLDRAVEISWVAIFPMPQSWPKWKKKALAGQRHQQKPDRDNIDKAILDALLANDERISDGTLKKRWATAGEGPSILLQVGYFAGDGQRSTSSL